MEILKYPITPNDALTLDRTSKRELLQAQYCASSDKISLTTYSATVLRQRAGSSPFVPSLGSP